MCVCIDIIVIATVVTVIALSYSYYNYIYHAFVCVLAELGKEKAVFIFYGPGGLKCRIIDEIKNSNFLRMLLIFIHPTI